MATENQETHGKGDGSLPDWAVPLKPQKAETAPYFSALLVLILAGLILGLGIWAHQRTLGVISVAVGEVKPGSRVQEVQHFEGGIVEAILVREGEAVFAGQSLLELSPTRGEADLAELSSRILDLTAERAWLVAEIEQTEAPNFPMELLDTAPELAEKAQQMFLTRRGQAEAEVARLRDLANVRQQEIRTIETRMTANAANLKLIEEQLSISQGLLEKGITNRFKHLQIEREVQQIKGSIAQDRELTKGAKAALAGAQNAIKEACLKRLQEARQLLADVERDLAEFRQRVVKFEDALLRTIIRAPVDGVIKEMSVATIGGVVQPGETVLEIVPGGNQLMVEAELPPQEIGYVKLGQRAVIRLNSSELVRFGHIEGTVSEISPDRLEKSDGQPYFRVRINAESSFFSAGKARYDLYPGAQVVANIHTGERSVLDYVTAPILSQGMQALQER